MKIKKIMLINPSNTIARDSLRRLITPMGLMYIGAMLKQNNYEVDILDSTCEGYYNTKINGDYLTYGLSDKDMIRRIKGFNPDIVGVTSMFSAQINDSLHCCKLVKSVDRTLPVVLGGIHPSLVPTTICRKDFVDYIVMGEGEYRFLNLLKCLENNQRPTFDGVAYNDNVFHKTTRIEDLNALPLPARELVDMEKYISIGVPFSPFPKRERVEQIATSRGCPGNCNFCCSVKYWGRSLRVRSVDNVMKEIDELVNKYRIQEIQFSDDNLTASKKRMIELCKQMLLYDLSWCTPNGIMVKTIDEELIELMAKSGCYQLTFALESANKRILKDIIHKNVPPPNVIKNLVKVCHDNGISVHGTFIVGFIGETKKEIRATLEYPFELDIDSASLFIVSPILGSELYYQCKEKGYLKGNGKADFKTSEINIPIDSPDYVISKKELERIVDNKTKEFNKVAKAKHPDAWDKKFKQFLKKHGDNADLILGRVT